MTAILATASVIVTVVAALTGAAVAIDQLTLRSRQRRLLALVDEIKSVEGDPARTAILDHLYLLTSAKVVAASLVPAKRFALHAYWLTISMVLGALALSLHSGPVIGNAIVGALAFLLAAFSSSHLIGQHKHRIVTFRSYIASPADIEISRFDPALEPDQEFEPKFRHALLVSCGLIFTSTSIGFLLKWSILGTSISAMQGIALLAALVIGSSILKWTRRFVHRFAHSHE